LKRRLPERRFRQYAALLAHESPLGETVDRLLAGTFAASVNPYLKAGAEPVDAAKLVPPPWVPGRGPRDKALALRDLLRSFASVHGTVDDGQ
jgi:hypothetical protein